MDDDIITVGSLKASVFMVTFFDSNVKRVYEEIKRIKPAYDKIDLVFVNSKLVFGLEHIIGIMKIINERKQRKIISGIKNMEIEFLMRVCCTDQISAALNINFGDKSNKDFVVVILSDEDQKLIEIKKEFERYGTVTCNTKKKNNDNNNKGSKTDVKGNSITSYYNTQDRNSGMFITADNSKRDYIIDMFFREKIKDSSSELFKSDTEFLKFLIERAAISLG